jgi:hypothetical protein
MVARTLQFQQEYISTGKIQPGRVEQTVQQQIKQKKEIEKKQISLREQQQKGIDDKQRELAQQQRDYESAQSLANVYLMGGTIKGSEYLRLNPQARRYYNQITKGYGGTPGGTVQVSGVGGFSVAPQLQESFATKYAAKGYTVETPTKIYSTQTITPTLPKDELLIDYEGYSVARERQAPFVLGRLGREQTALKKQEGLGQEVYTQMVKSSKPIIGGRDLIWTEPVKKINIFAGTSLVKGYEFTKKEGTKSFDILYGKSGLKARREKVKESESFKITEQKKEERESIFAGRRAKLKEATGADLELTGEKIASPFSSSIKGLGESFPKLKTSAGSYFEKRPEQLIFAKGLVIAGDWLTIGKMFPGSKKLPPEFRIKDLAKPKRKPVFEIDVAKDKFVKFTRYQKEDRRFGYYTSPTQQGGILFGTPIKRTYTPPRIVKAKGDVLVKSTEEDMFQIIGAGRAEVIKGKPQGVIKEFYVGPGYKKPAGDFNLGKQLSEKEKMGLLGKQYRKQGRGYKAALINDDTQITGAEILTGSYKENKGKTTLLNLQKSKIRVLETKIGDIPQGELYGFRSISKDATYPKIAGKNIKVKYDISKTDLPKTTIDKGILKEGDLGQYLGKDNKIKLAKKGDEFTYLHELGHSKVRKLLERPSSKNSKPLATRKEMKQFTKELEKKGVFKYYRKQGYKKYEVPEEFLVDVYAGRYTQPSGKLIKLYNKIRYPTITKLTNKVLSQPEFNYPAKDIIKAQSKGRDIITRKKRIFVEKEPKSYQVTQGRSIVPKQLDEGSDIIYGSLKQKRTRPPIEAIAQDTSLRLLKKYPTARPKPSAKLQLTPQSTKQSQASVSAFYGKGTYERTEGVQSVMPLTQMRTSLSPRLNTNLRSQSRTLTSEVSSTRLRQGLRSNEAMDEALKNLNIQRETLRQSQIQRQALRTPTKLQFSFRTPGKTVTTPRVPKVPRIPRRPTRIVRPFRFKIKSPKPSTRKQKDRRETTTRYSPSFAATTLNIRSKQKPLRTKGGYFFGFRPVLD